ncbi:hypothetical protein AZI87_07645 [Bdellovibrio bacteriovorus]|uniref:VCBS repeat-containing protein n=1 Tax=Bdellovibrio bacteriovorus TaxID=959 RepID=A0A162GWC6_BDEBC|nr:hypothetical protein [Bdellovibrio bacteriovorus]KYG69085.1 hypothetical protein AZI87_07645 [Bdellovibrio bacteriovorus]
MTSSDTTFKNKELVLMAVLALVAMALVTVAVVPSLRNKVKDAFLSSERNVVAKVSGSLSSEGPRVTVLKIQSKNSLSVEVFSQNEGGEMVLLAKLPLFENRDGYFLFKGNATNLALTDVDKDGSLEIVAPTYDDQMVPRLNIFRFNPVTKSFDRVTAPEGFEAK